MSVPRAAPAEDMVWIAGGPFRMGSDEHYPEEAPAHDVSVDGFWMDRFTVTNERFVDSASERMLAPFSYFFFRSVASLSRWVPVILAPFFRSAISIPPLVRPQVRSTHDDRRKGCAPRHTSRDR